jgi:hypothetical protein
MVGPRVSSLFTATAVNLALDPREESCTGRTEETGNYRHHEVLEICGVHFLPVLGRNANAERGATSRRQFGSYHKV